MRRLTTLSVLLLLAGAGFSAHGANQIEFFDAQGLPTARAKAELDWGTVKIKSGANIPLAFQDAAGHGVVADESACITLAFRITANGEVDKFQVWDSVPKNGLGPAAMSAIKQWRFVNTGLPVWRTLPISFAFTGPSSSFDQPSHIKNASRAAGFVAQCVVADEEIDQRPAAGLARVPPGDPAPASADLLRAHPAGCVTIAFRIGADGAPADLDLLDARPDQSFVDTAAVQIQGWRYQRVPSAKEAGKMPNPGYGFVRLGYSDHNSSAAKAVCMTADFAAAHYQPTGATP